jgi:hypothetical protein
MLKFRQLQGGLCPPDPPTRGFASGPHWGAKPLDPLIDLRYRVHHDWPPKSKLLDPPLVSSTRVGHMGKVDKYTWDGYRECTLYNRV